MRKIPILVLVLCLSGTVLAQQSTSHKLEEHVLNAGGHPETGTILTSSSFRMTLDALGESVVGRDLSSPSYRMDGGFGSGYPPPGEVLGLHFTDDTTLAWDPERSVGVYNLYRDNLNTLSGLGSGRCEQWGLADETATDSEEVPSPGYFYLVTAENRLSQEGTDSSHDERPNNSPCP